MTSSSSVQKDSEINILFEDQKLINKFAWLNSVSEDLKMEINNINSQIKTYEDSALELAMNEDSDVYFKVGDTFILMDEEEAENQLESAKEKQKEKLKATSSRIEDIHSQMSNLKTTLYGKFGDAINLEHDEE